MKPPKRRMSISRRSFLALSAATTASPVARAITASSDSPTTPTGTRSGLERLDALAQGAVSSRSTPGIALSVWKGGKQTHSCTVGMANLECGSRVTDASIFRIGSVTKQFTAALILKLVSAGKLSLSDPAQEHLPTLSTHEPFTVLELLNHTAGVRDGDYDTAGLRQHTQIEVAERIAGQKPFFDFRPGTAWLYSNANYILIGAVVEQVTGMPLAEAAARLLFDPLGLEHTAFDTAADVVTGRVSGYTPTDVPNTPFQNAEYVDARLAGGAGAMRSTASDLCRWHHALFHENILPDALTATMTMPGKLRNGQLATTNRFSSADSAMGDAQYGLGLFLDNATRDESLIAGHHGGINGFASYLASHPSSGLSYACLCNADTHPGLPFRDIRRTVFSEILKAATTG